MIESTVENAHRIREFVVRLQQASWRSFPMMILLLAEEAERGNPLALKAWEAVVSALEKINIRLPREPRAGSVVGSLSRIAALGPDAREMVMREIRYRLGDV